MERLDHSTALREATAVRFVAIKSCQSRGLLGEPEWDDYEASLASLEIMRKREPKFAEMNVDSLNLHAEIETHIGPVRLHNLGVVMASVLDENKAEFRRFLKGKSDGTKLHEAMRAAFGEDEDGIWVNFFAPKMIPVIANFLKSGRLALALHVKYLESQ